MRSGGSKVLRFGSPIGVAAFQSICLEARAVQFDMCLDACLRYGYIPRMRAYKFYANWRWLIFFFGGAACFAQNADSAKRNEAVAIVGGETIYEADLLPSVQAQLIKLRS